MTSCERCRTLLRDQTLKNAAANVEQQCPDCHCEQYCVGEGSPGRVDDPEILYRMFTDPTDVDEQTGKIARDAFDQAYKDGLSIIREQATDHEVEAVVKDILSVKPERQLKRILAIFAFQCAAIRAERCAHQGSQHKAFCVYDQTVPRVLEPNEPPVPTHGTIMSRRLYEKPITRRQFENDCNDTLHRIITVQALDVETFRNGLVAALNARSLAGEFVRTA
jgi:hypothetical protein